jgi:hypothetical protein
MRPDRTASAEQAGRPAAPATAPGEPQEGLVVRRTPDGWRVDGIGRHAGDGGGDGARSPAGDDHIDPAGEVLPDLVSAMVLAELLAGDVPRPRKPAVNETSRYQNGAEAASAGIATGPGSTGSDGGAVRDETWTRGSDGGRASGGSETTRLKTTIAQLEHALATRVRIEQAIGVLAERHRLTPLQAFDLLRKVARSGGSRVHDLAGEVVASATNPLLLLPAELARPPLQPPRGRPRRKEPR